MTFREEQETKVEKIEGVLVENLPLTGDKQALIFESMEYALMAGGKRIRPMLMQEVYQLFGGTGKEIEYFLTAIEMIHTYSLVHDDLPAMDDDDYRRGRKTTHIVYGEDMGILTGDALLNYAFEIATKAFDLPGVDSKRVGRALQALSRKAGVFGMIGGQVVDVKSSGQQINSDTLDFIFQLKTSALIEAPMMIGAILAGAEEEQIQEMEEVGRLVGMAFQIQDDILDVTATTETLGKPVLSDEKNQKTTYVTLHGLEAAKIAVASYSEKAIEILEHQVRRNEFLETLIHSLIHRGK